GSLGKTGAAALAATAALRAGVGLVTVATPASQQPVVAGLVLEAMTESLPETGARTLALKAREVVTELAAARDALALGPGVGLAGHLDVLRSAPAARCLTPHPGEMARLLGGSVADVQRDRLKTVRQFATRHRVHVVLKGAWSAIGDPEGRVFVNPTGNPGMAS